MWNNKIKEWVYKSNKTATDAWKLKEVDTIGVKPELLQLLNTLDKINSLKSLGDFVAKKFKKSSWVL